MIVAEADDAYRFVTQPDHAALAGQFADRWGGEAFGRPEPFSAVALAAYRHDDGWWGYDRRPRLHPDGTPVDFTEVPAETWVDLYDRGVDDAVELDPYAGLLVSMHGAGLRRRRYGLSPSWPDTPDDFADFVERQESRQSRLAHGLRETGDGARVTDADVALLAALHGSGQPPEGTESRLWRNYQLLQAWDTLSLAFCTTLSPPGYDEVGPVPTADAGADGTLAIEPGADGAFRVEPYPFDEEPLVVTVPARTVRKDAFDGEAGLVRAYYEARRETVEFTLVA